MADDDASTNEAGSGDTPPPTPPPAEDKPASGQKSEEKPPEETSTEKWSDLMTKWEANTARLNELAKNATEREARMHNEIEPAMKKLQSLVNEPTVPPPEPMTMPPPPTEQQKGGLAEFVVNLLKFGALATIAFGMGRRGAGHSYIWKTAIGAALTSYAKGRSDISSAAMHLWEKNREVVNDYNREQNANYRAILQDHRLDLTQKMDMINALSTEYRDYRTADAAERQDLTALQKSMDDQMRAQRAQEKWVIEHRHKIYDAIGKQGQDGKYFAWVYQKSHIQMDANWTADQYYDFVKAHPELAMSEFNKHQMEEEIKKVREKAEATARGKEAATQPEKTEPDERSKEAAEALKKEVSKGLGF
jgi:hypothetical protein